MLCTLVIAIGTFPYALRVVAIPWSLDQDRSWASCFGEVLWSFASVPDWERWKLFIAHVFHVFFSADEEKKHVYALEYFVDVWFFSFLRFGASSMCNLDVWRMDISRRVMSLRNFLLRLMSAQLMSTTASTRIDTIARKVQRNSRNMPDDNELRSFAMSEAIFSRWARLFSQRRITNSMIQSGPYWDRKTWTLIEGTR